MFGYEFEMLWNHHLVTPAIPGSFLTKYDHMTMASELHHKDMLPVMNACVGTKN